MCAVLPVAWPGEGACIVPPVATHVPPPKPGGTRFYARDVAAGQYFGLESRTVFREGYHERAVELGTPGRAHVAKAWNARHGRARVAARFAVRKDGAMAAEMVDERRIFYYQ